MTRPLPIALVGPSANGVATAAAMSGGRDQAELADYLMQVGHALNLVCELPEWLERSPLPKHLRHAAVECFAMNCRVLVEFLWSTARYGSDVRACDYCGGATIDRPVPPDAKSFGDKYVAHLSDARVDDPLVSTSYAGRCKIRDELIAVAREFASTITDDAARMRMGGYVEHACLLAAWPPPATGGEDPRPYIDALTTVVVTLVNVRSHIAGNVRSPVPIPFDLQWTLVKFHSLTDGTETGPATQGL